MNNLIINGIDHSKFDLEWAKRGGVICGHRLDFFKQIDHSAMGINGKIIVYCIDIGNGLATVKSFISEDLRMATPSECAEAGIEYIEPPTQWLPIESAPKNDKAILLTDGKAVYRGNYYDDKYAKTPRPYWDVGLNRSTDNRSVNITRWMPLPQPPKDE